MKNYLVTLNLRIGHYEKHTRHLVKAASELDAGHQALMFESHNTEDVQECIDNEAEVWDDDMHYQVYSCEALDDKDQEVLSKYL